MIAQKKLFDQVFRHYGSKKIPSQGFRLRNVPWSIPSRYKPLGGVWFSSLKCSDYDMYSRGYYYTDWERYIEKNPNEWNGDLSLYYDVVLKPFANILTIYNDLDFEFLVDTFPLYPDSPMPFVKWNIFPTLYDGVYFSREFARGKYGWSVDAESLTLFNSKNTVKEFFK